MMDKNMDFFMENSASERPEITIPGISKFRYPCDGEGYKKGDVIPWVLKSVTTEEFDGLTENNTTRKKTKGRIIKTVDEKRLTAELMVETIKYPDFKNEEWLKREKLLDPSELLMQVLDLPGDFTRISNEVCAVNGIGEDEEELIKEAKN